MTKLVLAIVVAMAAYACTREDGEPDPPVQTLVPCHPDAGSDDPLACPPPVDAGVDGGT
jgi:hypothetical protein